MTLFSKSEHYFPVVAEGDPVPAQPFLSACISLMPLLDVFGSTVFAPVKNGVVGDIQRIEKKHKSDPDKFYSLQSIADWEVSENLHTGNSSCTLAILWLKRSLEFCYVFLETVLTGEQNLVVIARKAYTESLKKYHSWIVRGLFALIVRWFPTYNTFISSLKSDPETTDEQLMTDIKDTLERLKTGLDELNRFFTLRKLDNDDVV